MRDAGLVSSIVTGLGVCFGINSSYDHRDIAFEIGSWFSPVFKLYLIKEFHRLKDEESRATSLEWSFRRAPKLPIFTSGWRRSINCAIIAPQTSQTAPTPQCHPHLPY
jgi:hypothetical protein